MVRASICSFRTFFTNGMTKLLLLSGQSEPWLWRKDARLVRLDTQRDHDDDSQLSYIETVMAPLMLEALLGSSMEEQCG